MKPSFLIIGLGNPGAQYDGTRHNIGFHVVDKLQETLGEGEWSTKSKFDAEICDARIGVLPVLLVKPMSYMNLSGDPIRKIVDFYSLDPARQIIVLSDDIDLELGDIRFREKGGPGTHNGLKSIVSIFGEDFARVRIGVGAQPQGYDLSAWVLSKMKDEESKLVEERVGDITDKIRGYALSE